jgi:pyruvate/oxaloacetate carboxyltransferase
MDRLRNGLKWIAESDDDVLTYALFPNIALDFFRNRRERLKLHPGDKGSLTLEESVA